MGVEELSEKLKIIVKNGINNFLDLLGAAQLNENFLDQLVTETDFMPNDEDHNNFISFLVINKNEITLWTRNRRSHSNTWYWVKREFESLEEYVEFATDFFIDTMVERKIFQILRESSFDKKNEISWINFIIPNYRLIRHISNIQGDQNKIRKVIQSDLISERELYFQSKEFQEIKLSFEKCRKNLL